jgi:hypothetical protein
MPNKLPDGLAAAIERFIYYRNSTSIKHGNPVTIGDNDEGIPRGTLLYPVRFYHPSFSPNLDTYFFRNAYNEWQVIYDPRAVATLQTEAISQN